MARVKIKTSKVLKAIEKVFKDTKTNKKLLAEIGDFSVDRIVLFARTGKRMAGNKGQSLNSARKFKQLSPTTVQIRKSLSTWAPDVIDGQFFRNSKRSNVTQTGQLLKSINFKLNKASLSITVSGSRAPIDYERIAKRVVGKSVSANRDRNALTQADVLNPKPARTNSEVYDNLVSLGFGFIGLDKKALKRIKRIVLDEFRRTIKKTFE